VAALPDLRPKIGFFASFLGQLGVVAARQRKLIWRSSRLVGCGTGAIFPRVIGKCRAIWTNCFALKMWSALRRGRGTLAVLISPSFPAASIFSRVGCRKPSLLKLLYLVAAGPVAGSSGCFRRRCRDHRRAWPPGYFVAGIGVGSFRISFVRICFRRSTIYALPLRVAGSAKDWSAGTGNGSNGVWLGDPASARQRRFWRDSSGADCRAGDWPAGNNWFADEPTACRSGNGIRLAANVSGAQQDARHHHRRGDP